MTLHEDTELIERIAIRARKLLEFHGKFVPPGSIKEELIITHQEICPLRLRDLLEANDFDFLHDITGMRDHINMLDASFRNGWWPRYAA